MKKSLQDKPLTSIRQMLCDAVEIAPDAVLYRYIENDAVRDVTAKEFYGAVEALGAKLTAMGLGDAHIACVGENSYPWIETYLCALLSAGTFVPLDRELPPDDLIYLLNESDAQIVFCDHRREELLASRRTEIPGVRYIVCFTRREDDGDLLSFGRLIAAGRSMDKSAFDALRRDPDALCDLVFTSGATGRAKGVMLTEHNLCSGIYYGMQVSSIRERGLSVLPYHHTYEAVCDILVSIRCHATLCINDSIRHLRDNFKRFQPVYVYLVPAFSEHFYDLVRKNVEKAGAKARFDRAVALSEALRKIGIDLRRLIFKSILEEFGGKLERIVCGGAPIRPEIGEFFDKIGITLTGGYGITECSPLVSVNDAKGNNFASAGHKLACLDWQIDAPDADGIGEILLRGDVVMKGYYKRPDLTAEVMRDGWFCTGDFGYINERDELVITGRKKNIIVLNNGKNIYPEELETLVSRVPGVSEVVVRGVKNEFLQDVALMAEIYSEEGISSDALLPLIRQALAALPCYKQISKIVMRGEPFFKTTSQKIVRQG